MEQGQKEVFGQRVGQWKDGIGEGVDEHCCKTLSGRMQLRGSGLWMPSTAPLEQESTRHEVTVSIS